MTHTIVHANADRTQDRDVIAEALDDFNRVNAPPANIKMLGLLLRSDGATVGGLWGRSAYEWLFVELLFVPEPLRGTGVGHALMQQAEEVARQRNCTGVWLDTFAFQALGFYKKIGYTVFGRADRSLAFGRPRRSTRLRGLQELGFLRGLPH